MLGAQRPPGPLNQAAEWGGLCSLTPLADFPSPSSIINLSGDRAAALSSTSQPLQIDLTKSWVLSLALPNPAPDPASLILRVALYVRVSGILYLTLPCFFSTVNGGSKWPPGSQVPRAVGSQDLLQGPGCLIPWPAYPSVPRFYSLLGSSTASASRSLSASPGSL